MTEHEGLAIGLPVIFKPSALAEIEAGYGWYELQATGLGAEFLRRVKLLELGISRDPLLYPVVRRWVRRATLRRFPYALFYIVEPERVVVLGCLHHRRDPKAWPDPVGEFLS